MKYVTKGFLLMLLCICPGFLMAQISQPSTLWVLEDSTGSKEIADVLAQQALMEETDDFKPGHSSSAFWLSVPTTWMDSLERDEFYAVITHPIISYIDFYWVRGDSVIKSLQTGNMRPFSVREYPSNRFSFHISEPKPGDRLLIRLQNTEGTLKAPLVMFSKDQFFSYIQKANFFSLLILGIILFQFLYALLQSVLIRKKLFFWYAGFVLSVWAHQFMNKGYGYMYWPENWMAFYDMVRICTFPALLFTLSGFAYHLLDIKRLFPQMVSRIVVMVIAIHGLAPLTALLPLPSYPDRFVLISAYYIFAGITLIGMMVFAALAARKGNRPAYYYLVAHIPIGLMVLFYLVLNYGMLPYRDYFYYFSMLTALYEASISLIAISIYINKYGSSNQNWSQNIPSKEIISVHPSAIPNGSENGHSQLEDLDLELESAEIPEYLLEQFDRLTVYFQTEKPYLNPNLKISDVAGALDISIHELSRTINQCGKIHFFDFVNTYRVDYAKELLKCPEHYKKYTMEVIGLQSGFNNRVSFNTAFKRFTQITPTEFRKSYMNEVES